MPDVPSAEDVADKITDILYDIPPIEWDINGPCVSLSAEHSEKIIAIIEADRERIREDERERCWRIQVDAGWLVPRARRQWEMLVAPDQKGGSEG